MSEESIVTVVVALIGSAIVPALINKFKPKHELDSTNIQNAINLLEATEKKYDNLSKRFDNLEIKYEKVIEENYRLEEDNDHLKRENEAYRSRISELESRVKKLEDELEREGINEIK